MVKLREVFQYLGWFCVEFDAGLSLRLKKSAAAL
jgi:hypothetical protein